MGVPDNGPVIVGITWWLTFFCGAFLGLRIYAKLSRRQKLWWDDHVLITSWLFLLVEAIVTQIGQSLGFGKHTADIPVQNLVTIVLCSSVGASISCFASTLSKISFGLTLLRLTKGLTRCYVWFCVISLFLVMLPSAIMTWIQCRPMARAWNSSVEGTCWPAYVTLNYGIFNAAWCAAADFSLALLPWKVIWSLQLDTREKFGVSIAMSMGVLSGVCAIVKGVYLVQLRQQDFFYNGKDVTIWTAVETATAITAASLPVLRAFFKETISSFEPSHGRSHTPSATANIFVSSHIHRSQQSTRDTSTVQGMGRTKDDGWVSLGNLGEECDNSSQTSILRQEDDGLGSGNHGLSDNKTGPPYSEDLWQRQGH